MEDFEDRVLRGLLLNLEKRVRNLKHCEEQGCKSSDIYPLLRIPPYFAPYQAFNPQTPIPAIIPQIGGFAGFSEHVGFDRFYATNGIYRKIDKLPKVCKHLYNPPGRLYQLLLVTGDDKGLIVHPHYFTIDRKTDNYYSCLIADKGIEVYSNSHFLGMAFFASTGASEKSLFYNVKGSEDEAFAEFGVQEEQMKSLFYARSLPMTETGRKRPLIHWVRSHRRRLKAGIDINIKEHLRGIKDFEMYGTVFEITNPAKLKEVACVY